MEVLRALFGQRDDGVWQIQSLMPVPLNPENGGDHNFYPVKDDLFFADPPFIGTIRYTLGQSIVPLVAHVPGENVLMCLGTGFFISCSGFLITAAHVITDPIDRRYGGLRELDDGTWYLGRLKVGVMIPTNPLAGIRGYIFREIEWASFLAERIESPLVAKGTELKLMWDTALCKVAPLAKGVPYQPLAIVQRGLKGIGTAIGKAVTVVGYGEMQDVELSQESENVISGDFRFTPHVSIGKVLQRFPDNTEERQVSTPGACFSTSAKLPAGMSGSPIFDDERIYVHGVVSKSWDFERGQTNLGYGSMLAPCWSLPINPLNGKTLTELQMAGNHGIPLLSIPDA